MPDSASISFDAGSMYGSDLLTRVSPDSIGFFAGIAVTRWEEIIRQILFAEVGVCEYASIQPIAGLKSTEDHLVSQSKTAPIRFKRRYFRSSTSKMPVCKS